MISTIINSLSSQRDALAMELINMNHSEVNSMDKRICIENAITSIDMQLDMKLSICETEINN